MGSENQQSGTTSTEFVTAKGSPRASTSTSTHHLDLTNTQTATSPLRPLPKASPPPDVDPASSSSSLPQHPDPVTPIDPSRPPKAGSRPTTFHPAYQLPSPSDNGAPDTGTTATTATPLPPSARTPPTTATGRMSASKLTPGAALFSVPPASPPPSGVYALPEEAFVLKDLDSGRNYEVNKHFWIKDVDTGAVYILEEGPPPEGDAAAAASQSAQGHRTPSPANNEQNMHFTDLLSGQQLSLDQFEEAMGYKQGAGALALSAAASARSPSHLMNNVNLMAAMSPSSNPVQHLAQRSLLHISSAANASASWLKGRAAAVVSKMGSKGREVPVSGFSPFGAGGGEGVPGDYSGYQQQGGGYGFGSMSGLPDPNGLPVRVVAHKKQVKEFADVRLVQEIQAHQGVVWCMKFSRNGRYLASSGQDSIIRVWEAIPNRGNNLSTSGGGGGGGGGGGTSASGMGSGTAPSTPTGAAGAAGTSAGAMSTSGLSSESGSPVGAHTCPGVAVIKPRPHRTYRGHKQDVLDVAWSRTHFLLSASMDKTVRLWHVSMDECLRVFKHSDFVTAIDFHPTDDKLFISGSIDGKVRMWNVPDQRVMSWQDVHEMVTAVGYSRSAQRAVVGTMRGKCRFYAAADTSGLEYEAQLDVKNKRGQHSRGKKVTGVVYSPVQSGALLVTSNDSRIRLYDGYSLRCKYKGHSNRSTQIRASFSPKGDYVICGSDNGWVYIWNTNKAASSTSGLSSSSTTQQPVPALSPRPGSAPDASAPASATVAKEKNSSYESFQASTDIVTVATFAPETSKRSIDSMPGGESGKSGAAGAARGQVIVVAGYGGEIKFYENLAMHPQLL